MVCLSSSTAPQPSGEPTELSVITFPGSNRWPLWVAQVLGLDVRKGLRLNVLDTRDSREQMTGLVDGRFDIAITAFDNVVAYNEGVGNPDRPPAPIIALMGLDNGFLSLVTKPEFATVADLKGQELSVDALTTGYAFTLQETLRRAGLSDGDYTLVSTGGANLRYDALVARQFAGTLLMPPFTAMAERQGLKRLADVSTTLGHYQGGVVAVRADWAEANRALITAYLVAHLEALAWLYDPANREAAIEIYRKHLPDAPAAAAGGAYDSLIDPVSGFWRDGELDDAGMSAVLEMRTRYGPGNRTMGPASRYSNTAYLAEARSET